MKKLNSIKENSLVLILLLLAINTISQDWIESVNISTMNGVNQTPGFTVDNEGNLHCVWAYVVNDDYSNIYYSKSEDNGITWSSPENISLNIEKRLINPNIVTDSEGEIHVTYDYNMNQPVHSKILMKTYNGFEWSPADTISGTMLNCSKNKLVIDHNNRIYCFWNIGVNVSSYYYRYYEEGMWSSFYHPYPDTGISFIKLVVDNVNNIHCLGSLFDYNIFYTYMNFNAENETWNEIEQITEKTWGGLGADLDVNFENYPNFTWRQKTPNTGNIFEEDSTMYRYYDGNTWTAPELVTEDPFEQKIQVISNKPFILDWEKSEGEGGNIVFYEKDNSANWVGEIVAYVIGGIEVLAKSENKVHLLYRSKPDDDNLNIYYTCKAVDTTTYIEIEKFNLKTLKLYPNPFISNVNIDFSILNKSLVSIKVYSFIGELVRTIENNTMNTGDYTYTWDGTNINGRHVKPGIYLIRLQAGNNIISRSIEFIN